MKVWDMLHGICSFNVYWCFCSCWLMKKNNGGHVNIPERTYIVLFLLAFFKPTILFVHIWDTSTPPAVPHVFRWSSWFQPWGLELHQRCVETSKWSWPWKHLNELIIPPRVSIHRSVANYYILFIITFCRGAALNHYPVSSGSKINNHLLLSIA